MQSHRDESPPPALERELHRPAKHSRFGRRAVAREGSHQVDAILVPAASRAGRQDEKLAAVALDEVAVGNPLVANSCREDRVGILRAARMRNAFRAEKRHNCCVSAEREAAKDRQAEDREVEPAGVSGGAPVRGQAQATNQRLRARHAAAGFAADLHPGALERVSAALEAASEVARKQVQATRVQEGVARRARESEAELYALQEGRGFSFSRRPKSRDTS